MERWVPGFRHGSSSANLPKDCLWCSSGRRKKGLDTWDAYGGVVATWSEQGAQGLPEGIQLHRFDSCSN